MSGQEAREVALTYGHGYDVVVSSDHGGPADEQRAHDAAAEAAHHH